MAFWRDGKFKWHTPTCGGNCRNSCLQSWLSELMALQLQSGFVDHPEPCAAPPQQPPAHVAAHGWTTQTFGCPRCGWVHAEPVYGGPASGAPPPPPLCGPPPPPPQQHGLVHPAWVVVGRTPAGPAVEYAAPHAAEAATSEYAVWAAERARLINMQHRRAVMLGGGGGVRK